VFSPNTERCRMGKVDGPLLDGPPCRRVVAQHLERRPPGLPLHAPTRLRRRHARTRSFASQEETWQNDVAIQQYAAAGCRALLRPRVHSSAHFTAPCCVCEEPSREARGLPMRRCSTLASGYSDESRCGGAQTYPSFLHRAVGCGVLPRLRGRATVRSAPRDAITRPGACRRASRSRCSPDSVACIQANAAMGVELPLPPALPAVPRIGCRRSVAGHCPARDRRKDGRSSRRCPLERLLGHREPGRAGR
jgi:hypothetical protein